jgi:hypothetical protein
MRRKKKEKNLGGFSTDFYDDHDDDDDFLEKGENKDTEGRDRALRALGSLDQNDV